MNKSLLKLNSIRGERFILMNNSWTFAVLMVVIIGCAIFIMSNMYLLNRIYLIMIFNFTEFPSSGSREGSDAFWSVSRYGTADTDWRIMQIATYMRSGIIRRCTVYCGRIFFHANDSFHFDRWNIYFTQSSSTSQPSSGDPHRCIRSMQSTIIPMTFHLSEERRGKTVRM